MCAQGNKNEKKRLAIVGGGELGQQMLNLAQSGEEFEVVGFFDDTMQKGAIVTDQCTVVGGLNDIVAYYESGKLDCIILGIGYKHMAARANIFEDLSKKVPFATLIHQSCIIDPSVKIGQGAVVYPGCILDKNVVIGENTLLNLGVVVAHDTKVGSHCFIAPRVVFSGFVNIMKSCFIGTGTIFKDNITISSDITIGAGALVNKDLTDADVYIGSPVRKLKKNK